MAQRSDYVSRRGAYEISRNKIRRWETKKSSLLSHYLQSWKRLDKHHLELVYFRFWEVHVVRTTG